MSKLFLSLGTVLLIAAPAAWAQTPGEDPIEALFVPPEVIMQNQRALGIDGDQRQRIVAAVTEAQRTFSEMQWELQAEGETLAELLAARGSSKQDAIDQLDRMLAIEATMKKTHISLLIDIREILTPEQYERALRMKRPGERTGSP